MVWRANTNAVHLTENADSLIAGFSNRLAESAWQRVRFHGRRQTGRVDMPSTILLPPNPVTQLPRTGLLVRRQGDKKSRTDLKGVFQNLIRPQRVTGSSHAPSLGRGVNPQVQYPDDTRAVGKADVSEFTIVKGSGDGQI